MKAILIAGTHSGCGKTTITLSILAGLKKLGYAVQAFKAGPDYIDTGLHRLVTSLPSYNLDVWMCGQDYVKDLFTNASHTADIAVIESAMGLYDGQFSPAYLAGLLNVGFILVLDARGMAESVGAIVHGYRSWRLQNQTLFKGVILNKIASTRHLIRAKSALADTDCFGFLPANAEIVIPSRHLGLTVAEEAPIDTAIIDKLAQVAINHINLDALLSASKYVCNPSQHETSASYLTQGYTEVFKDKLKSSHTPFKVALNKGKIAVAYDKAFCFYYQDCLEYLRKIGFELVFFSPLKDTALPQAIDAVYLGGGYPELYAEMLFSNYEMLRQIRDWVQSGGYTYAECGGLMYLGRTVKDLNDKVYQAVGIYGYETIMQKKRATLGYREITLKADCILGKAGTTLRGHEFHYSLIISSNSDTNIYACVDNYANQTDTAGYLYKNCLASYVHVHFGCLGGF